MVVVMIFVGIGVYDDCNGIRKSVFGMKTTQVDCPFGLRADTKHMVGKKNKKIKVQEWTYINYQIH